MLYSQASDNLCNHGFHVFENFLETQFYNELCLLIQNQHAGGYFKPAKIGPLPTKSRHSSIRSDAILWLDETDQTQAIQVYFSELEQLRCALNQTLFLGLADKEAHFAVYEANSFYKKHRDQFATICDRRISCVYYLNPAWQPSYGGDLVLYTKEDKKIVIAPQGNRFVCFNSDILHEVRLAHQKRYSIAAWLKVRPFDR